VERIAAPRIDMGTMRGKADMGQLKHPIGPGARHVCIDMQRLFSPDGPWPTRWMTRVLPVVEALTERAPHRTIFTRFMPPERADDMPGQWQAYYTKWAEVTRARLDPALVELMPSLQRFVPPASVFDKRVYSAFADGRLATLLAAEKVDTLLVTGSETDVCVLATVLAAVDHGYRVIVVRDAVCSSSDEAHDAMLDLYHKRFEVQIEAADAEEIMCAWRPG
jgi:nicotinamidase-related amidase